MSKKKKKKYYLIIKGHKSGLYRTWFGSDGAAEQVQGYNDAVYKGFHTKEEALKWLGKFRDETLQKYAPNLLDLVKELPNSQAIEDNKKFLAQGKVLVYTDGGANPNPGPGGYGVVIRNKEKRKELSGGFRLTTNNRMELLACIKGLESLTEKSDVILFSDSQYVVNAIEKGWAKNWRAKNWKAKKGELRTNHDLWKKLLSVYEKHDVEFRWVKGHAGNMDNERCNQLASQMARRRNLPVDEGYEKESQATQLLL
ncbi:MAG: ribonuclease HI [Anaerolineae bacterium]|nr:ribonuclease HI [Anaerolineae bacterium]